MGGDPSQFVSYGKSASPTKRVFCSYTAALSVGYPVCYDHDSNNTYQNSTDTSITQSTAADSRRLVVEKPSVANNLHFAGVLAHNYAANTGGQWVEIYPPGSICNIRIASTADTSHFVTTSTLNTGQLLTFGVGKWYFKKGGFSGQGSANTLQNVTGTAPASPTTAWAELQTGRQSGGYQQMHVYTALVTLLVSTSNGITRGGVTEILSGVDGSATGIAAITTRYVLTNGDYIGQRKLIRVNTSVGYTVFEFFICIPQGTQHITTGRATPQLENQLLSAPGSIVWSSTLGEAAGGYMLAEWNGNAWKLDVKADFYS